MSLDQYKKFILKTKKNKNLDKLTQDLFFF